MMPLHPTNHHIQRLATAEQVDAINAASGPYGILSVLLIILVGAVLYFFVLPKTLADKK